MSRPTDQLPGPIQIQTAGTDRWQLFAEPFSRCARDMGVLGVRTVDLLLRFCFGIREFTKRSDCILRVSLSACRSEMMFSDGTVIASGDPILELHFWNEHLIHCLGPHELFGWALCLERRIRLSLMLLADRMMADEDPTKFEAVHACLPISLEGAERVFNRLGFTIRYPKRTAPQRVHDFFESLLIYALMWAFHPYGGHRGKRPPKRTELWLSKADFQRLYGRPAHALQ